MKNIEFLKKQTEIIVNLYNTQRYEEVINKTKILIKKYPEQIIFYNVLALSLGNIGKYEEGIKTLNKAMRYNDSNIFVLNNLGLLNSNLDNDELAQEYLEKALSINSEFVDALVNLANLFLKQNKTDLAKKNFLEALKNSKNNQQLEIVNSSLGLFYQQIGNFDEALKHFKIVNKINPLNTQIDKSISAGHKYKNTQDEHFLSMKEKIKEINDQTKLKSLYFALSKAYEDLEDYDNSFYFLNLGNKIVKKNNNYNVEKDILLFNKIIKLFNNFKNNINIQNTKDYIFIIGMPRSGTTLTEQIISSHKNVYGAGELHFIERLIKKFIMLNDNFIVDNISEIKVDHLEKIQKEYVKSTENLGYKQKILVDKAPLNFRWIGFIKIIFPNSKIIHCNRDPMDTCFSNYKNSFGTNSLEFSYDLSDLGNYYNIYTKLMNFWSVTFPNQIYNISYENLVSNKEVEIKNLLKFCELEWDANCLLPHKNKKRVATASIEQVRNPIYKTSIKKWENYAKHLTSLKSIIN
jgi:tetratricopeptide (TPR) repeat protein